MTTPRGRTNRRRFLGTAAGTGLALHGLGTQDAMSQPSSAAQQGATPDAKEGQEMVGQAGMPRWLFSVYRVQDPYPGEIQVPQEAPQARATSPRRLGSTTNRINP
ncbi:MAG: twin-arginine translocation signal domain-containing protein [Chloroflexota bacterium]|nr:twin-arginine translocation signal domain-containing protein [Chloroflexota bacterium]